MSDEFIRQSLISVLESSLDSFVLQRGKNCVQKGDLGCFNPHIESSVVVQEVTVEEKGGNPKRGIEHNPVVDLRRKKLVSWVQYHYSPPHDTRKLLVMSFLGS